MGLGKFCLDFFLHLKAVLNRQEFRVQRLYNRALRSCKIREKDGMHNIMKNREDAQKVCSTILLTRNEFEFLQLCRPELLRLNQEVRHFLFRELNGEVYLPGCFSCSKTS